MRIETSGYEIQPEEVMKRILVLAAAITATGCGFWGGTGPTCTEEVFYDTWSVDCGCAALTGGEWRTTTGTQQVCGLDHDSDGALAPGAQSGACDAVASYLVFHDPDHLSWSCEPVSHSRVSFEDCP